MVPKGDLEQFQRKQVHCIRQKLHEINKQDVFNDSIVIENALASPTCGDFIWLVKGA
jgi:hypothetical protein